MIPVPAEPVERFLGAYNAIDAHLQALFARNPTPGAPEHQSFRSMVDWFAKRNPWWRDGETLRGYSNLRNILVHETLAPGEYVCLPTIATVERIELIRDALLHPERALPRFERRVQTLQSSDSLRVALRQMHARGFGHFPVYEGRQFVGLWNENALSRWLASQAERNDFNFDRAHVRDVLKSSRRRTWLWLDATRTVQEIAHRFHEDTWLEAILISPQGREDESLLGIVTRADVWQIENEKA